MMISKILFLEMIIIFLIIIMFMLKMFYGFIMRLCLFVLIIIFYVKNLESEGKMVKIKF